MSNSDLNWKMLVWFPALDSIQRRRHSFSFVFILSSIMTTQKKYVLKCSSVRRFIAQRCRPNPWPPPSLREPQQCPADRYKYAIIAREIYGRRAGPVAALSTARGHGAYRHRRSPRLRADGTDEKISPTDLGTAARARSHTRVYDTHTRARDIIIVWNIWPFSTPTPSGSLFSRVVWCWHAQRARCIHYTGWPLLWTMCFP